MQKDGDETEQKDEKEEEKLPTVHDDYRFQIIIPEVTNLIRLDKFKTKIDEKGIDFNVSGHTSIINAAIFNEIMTHVHDYRKKLSGFIPGALEENTFLHQFVFVLIALILWLN